MFGIFKILERVTISRKEYEEFLETKTRLEIVKEYLRKNDYRSVEAAQIALGVELSDD